MSEFPSNSSKAKTEPERVPAKKLDPVVMGEVKRRKKPLGKRLAETFVGGDAKSVWGYVAFDVLIPAAKDMFADAVSQGVERMIFGESRPSGRSRSRSGYRQGNPIGHVAYNRYSPVGHPREDRNDHRRDISRRSRASHDFDEIILNTRAEAEEVIDKLFEVVSKYDQATVSDLYELVGISANFTDEKYGWTDLRGSSASRVREGYLLNLPKPEPLD